MSTEMNQATAVPLAISTRETIAHPRQAYTDVIASHHRSKARRPEVLPSTLDRVERNHEDGMDWLHQILKRMARV